MRLLIGSFFIAAITIGSPGGSATADELTEVEADIARSAIGTIFSKLKGGPLCDCGGLSTQDLRFGDRRFTPTHGFSTTVLSDDVLVSYSLSYQSVVRIVFRNSRPPSYPAVDREGRRPDPLDLASKTVLIDELEARSTATSFAKAIRGDEMVDQLVLVNEGLSLEGDRLVYRYTWNEPTDDLGVSRFGAIVDVVVNPTSGKVVSYSEFISKVEATPPVNAEECREIVHHYFDGRMNFQLKRILLVNLWTGDGTQSPTWIARYSYDSDTGKVSGSCYVDAESGAVYTAESSSSDECWTVIE